MELISSLINEITSIDFDDFIVASLFFVIPFYFSKKAQTLFFHLLYSSIGIYMICTVNSDRILLDVKMLVGIGLLIPQVNFILYFIKDTIQTIKMMSVNAYYFFITIYYKILRLINWIKLIPLNIKIFFETFAFKKQNNEKEYFEEKKEEKSNYTSSEYKRFYSDDPYIVLGVNHNDDFIPTIKKAYRKLVNKYHPDVNQDKIKFATEITQLINGAYSKITESHK